MHTLLSIAGVLFFVGFTVACAVGLYIHSKVTRAMEWQARIEQESAEAREDLVALDTLFPPALPAELISVQLEPALLEHYLRVLAEAPEPVLAEVSRLETLEAAQEEREVGFLDLLGSLSRDAQAVAQAAEAELEAQRWLRTELNYEGMGVTDFVRTGTIVEWCYLGRPELRALGIGAVGDMQMRMHETLVDQGDRDNPLLEHSQDLVGRSREELKKLEAKVDSSRKLHRATRELLDSRRAAIDARSPNVAARLLGLANEARGEEGMGRAMDAVARLAGETMLQP